MECRLHVRSSNNVVSLCHMNRTLAQLGAPESPCSYDCCCAEVQQLLALSTDSHSDFQSEAVGATSGNVLDRIKHDVDNNKVMLYMKVWFSDLEPSGHSELFGPDAPSLAVDSASTQLQVTSRYNLSVYTMKATRCVKQCDSRTAATCLFVYRDIVISQCVDLAQEWWHS